MTVMMPTSSFVVADDTDCDGILSSVDLDADGDGLVMLREHRSNWTQTMMVLRTAREDIDQMEFQLRIATITTVLGLGQRCGLRWGIDSR